MLDLIILAVLASVLAVLAILACHHVVLSVLSAQKIANCLVCVTCDRATDLVDTPESLSNNTLTCIGNCAYRLISSHEEVADRGI